jgi:cell division GTPase FtsZ
MKRRAFIGVCAVALGTIALSKVELFTAQSKEYHYVGIGRGACNVLDEVIKQNTNVKITKAIGIDTDYLVSSKQNRLVYSGTPIEPILNSLLADNSPLVIIYCLGGASNADAAISFIEKLKQQKRDFKLIVQFPFSFEGKRRAEQAISVANRLSKLSGFRSLHANQLSKESEKKTLGNIFQEANQHMNQLTKKG